MNKIQPGTIVISLNPMDGFLNCEGQQVKQADYPALYAAIGHAYGTADGFNFRLPKHIAGHGCLTIIKT